MPARSCTFPVFGPLAPTKLESMGVRFFAPPPDGGGGGGGGGGEEFTPPADQAALDKLINDAVGRAHAKYKGFDDFKAKADKWDAHEQAEKDKAKGGDGDKPAAGLTQEDVNTQIKEALAAKDAELALERAGDALDKALEGRTYSASLIRSLDLSQFVKDGKTDQDELKTWIEKNTKEGPAPSRRDPGQGERDANATGGTVTAGRDLFDTTHKKANKKE